MTDTATTNRIGEMLALPSERTLGLAKGLLSGIDAKDFAKQPSADGKIIDTNHPAFVYGHLALYPTSVIELLGHDGKPHACPDPWQDLFKHGATCEHDADGSKYPPMDEIVSKFETSHAAFVEAIKNTDDETFLSPIKEESWREFLGTNGAMAGFMIHNHVMFHLGQVSAWRRMMGLGSAM